MPSQVWLKRKSWLFFLIVFGYLLSIKASSNSVFPPDSSSPSTLALGLSPLLSHVHPQKIDGSLAGAPLNRDSRLKQLMTQSIFFVANQGQFPDEIDFYLQDKERTIFFSREGISFLLPGKEYPWAVKIKFVNIQKASGPIPLEKAEAFFSFFKGEKDNWRTAVPAYRTIGYNQIWPGIDLVYSSCDEGIKSQLVIKPGADPLQICFQVEGAEKIEINENNELVIRTPEGSIVDTAPLAYQEKNGHKAEIKVSYQIYDDFAFGFSLSSYDPSLELIIDPITLVDGTYLGGSNWDYAYGLALDDAGFVYLTGYTYSISGFPLMAGPQLNFNGGDVDAYIIKLDPKSSRLIYCGYLGGSDRDYAYDIAVDPEGCAYIVGYTASREDSFPVFIGPDLTHNGEYDAFVAKINAMGTKLEYCGFIGGKENDFGRAIAVDPEGRAYLTGYTLSDENSFPVKLGPYLTFKKNYDVFIARISQTGEQLEYCGYLGGHGHDWAYGIAVDEEGAAYVAGATASDENSFPVKTGPDLTFNGQVDAFVAKISPSGEEIVYCGYIGGEGEDVAQAIAVDSAGFAYITGYTGSTEKTFPVTFGPDFDYNGGFYDAFVAKVFSAGTYLVYCGYLGGSGYDVGLGLAVDSWGCAYVTGFTSSNQESFPVKEGPELTFSGSFDAFLAKISYNGARIIFCGYIGGSEADYGQDVVVEEGGSGHIYLAGSTYSPDLAFPLKPGLSRSFQGRRDAFLAHYFENTISVTSPNGGEIWYSGLEKNITWYTVGEVGNVRIELSTDNGQSWSLIAEETENDGLYNWIVPEITSSTCLIRISEADDGVPSDTSDFVFVILNEPVIILTSPNGGEEWPVGSIQEIKWITGSAAVGDVRIEYSTDLGNNWIEIVDRTENDGLFEWEIPDTPSSQCLVRISEAEDGNPADISDAAFTIFSPQKPPEKSGKMGKVDKLAISKMSKINSQSKKAH